jgi:hypothetical protein
MTRISESFWDHVDQSAGADGCWPWQRAIIRSGYGSLWVEGRAVSAHRRAYELANGPIPHGPGYHGYVVMHSCDNRACCNPAHLSLGTQGDNNRDRDTKGRADVRPRGEDNHNSRFTRDMVIAVRQMRAEGASYGELVKRTGMSKSQVARICKGQSWSWLAGTPLGDYALSKAA